MKFWYLTKSGQFAWEHSYKWAGPFRNGLACVKEFSGQMGFIDLNGKTKVSAPSFQSQPTQFFEGRALILNGRKYGFIDLEGGICIEPQFYNASPFGEGVAAVQTSRGYAFIDSTGKIVTDRFYTNLERFSDGLAVAEIQSKYYYLDKGLKPIFGPYEYAIGFSEGVAYVSIDGQECFINRQGEVLFRNNWDSISQYSFDGRIKFTNGSNKCGCVDRNGNVVIQPIYDSVGCFSEGLAFVEKKSKKTGKIKAVKKTAINTAGEELFSIDAEEAGMFIEGYAPYQLNQKWGFVDQAGVVQVPPRYFAAGKFSQGYAVVAIAD